jgi:hypothetical protein
MANDRVKGYFANTVGYWNDVPCRGYAARIVCAARPGTPAGAVHREIMPIDRQAKAAFDTIHTFHPGVPFPPVLDGLTGYYHGGSFDAAKQLWADVSGQLNHASTGGSISRAAGGINGRDYIAGPTTGYVSWPQASCAAGGSCLFGLPQCQILYHLQR